MATGIFNVTVHRKIKIHSVRIFFVENTFLQVDSKILEKSSSIIHQIYYYYKK